MHIHAYLYSHMSTHVLTFTWAHTHIYTCAHTHASGHLSRTFQNYGQEIIDLEHKSSIGHCGLPPPLPFYLCTRMNLPHLFQVPLPLISFLTGVNPPISLLTGADLLLPPQGPPSLYAQGLEEQLPCVAYWPSDLSHALMPSVAARLQSSGPSTPRSICWGFRLSNPSPDVHTHWQCCPFCFPSGSPSLAVFHVLLGHVVTRDIQIVHHPPKTPWCFQKVAVCTASTETPLSLLSTSPPGFMSSTPTYENLLSITDLMNLPVSMP